MKKKHANGYVENNSKENDLNFTFDHKLVVFLENI